MSSIRKMKRSIQPIKKVDVELLTQLSYENGFDQGAKKQREMDIKFLAKVLVDLETLPGVGEKTAEKLRGLILSKFGYEPIIKQ